MQLVDKAQGVMVGLACGDALGALVEYIPNEFKKYLPVINNIQRPLPLEKLITEAGDELILNRLQNYINYMCLPGSYTDDTQQAVLLAYSLITQKGTNPAELARLFVQGARLNGYGDYGVFRHAGPGFMESVNNMMMFNNLDTCGAISAGNGAAMRIAPLGVFYHNDMDKLLQATIDMSLITHRDIRGIAAAGLVAFTVAHAIGKNPDSFKPYIWLKELEELITAMEELITLNYPTVKNSAETKHQVSASIGILEKILDTSEDEAIKILDEWAQTTSNNVKVYHHSPFALGSVLYSLFLFLNYYCDMEKAILSGVNGGGDSDTIAAMAGAMAGALYGYNNIPSSWVENVFNIDTLKELGESLVTGKPLSKNPLTIEKELSRKELEYRDYYRKILHNRLGFS